MTAPEQLTIETPEQIPLEFTLASVGSRFLALAVDTLIQSGALLILGVLGLGVLIAVGPRGSGTWALAVLLLAAFIVYYAYFALFEVLWQGQTPGKRVVGLRVITVSGRPMTVYQALLRNLVRIVDQLPGLYGVGIVSVLVTTHHQRLGDLVASTVVVHERPIEGEVGVADQPGRGERLGAGRLTAQEVAVIELFLQRRGDLDGPVRNQTSLDLANRVRRRLSLPPGGSDEDLLARVLVDYRGGGRR